MKLNKSIKLGALLIFGFLTINVSGQNLEYSLFIKTHTFFENSNKSASTALKSKNFGLGGGVQYHINRNFVAFGTYSSAIIDYLSSENYALNRAYFHQADLNFGLNLFQQESKYRSYLFFGYGISKIDQLNSRSNKVGGYNTMGLGLNIAISSNVSLNYSSSFALQYNSVYYHNFRHQLGIVFKHISFGNTTAKQNTSISTNSPLIHDSIYFRLVKSNAELTSRVESLEETVVLLEEDHQRIMDELRSSRNLSDSILFNAYGAFTIVDSQGLELSISDSVFKHGYYLVFSSYPELQTLNNLSNNPDLLAFNTKLRLHRGDRFTLLLFVSVNSSEAIKNYSQLVIKYPMVKLIEL